VAEDAISLITKDHREMENLFEQLQSGKGDRGALVQQVSAMLLAHSRAEEAHVYPAVAEAVPAERGEVHHGKEEHEQAEQLLRRLEVEEVGSAGFDSTLTELVDAVRHHVEEEESGILPALEKAVGTQRLKELGRDFGQRRQQELERLGAGGPAGAATRDELYAKAKEQDVPGRSKMNKEELAQAVDEEA
jgi:hypothetical protein